MTGQHRVFFPDERQTDRGALATRNLVLIVTGRLKLVAPEGPHLAVVRSGVSRRLSVEQVENGPPRLHGVDDELVAAVEPHDDQLEQATVAIEAKDELLRRKVVVGFALVNATRGGVEDVVVSDAVLTG